jgi:hypothetical protein
MKCGFAKVDITPKVGCHLAGHPQVRPAEAIADPLYIRALSFEEGEGVVFLVFDVMSIVTETAALIRRTVAEALGWQTHQIHVAATHTHYAPYTCCGENAETDAFARSLPQKAVEAAKEALADAADAEFRYAKGVAPGISFIRRYIMKDGSVRTNPGRHNPDILRPASEADETLQLLRIVREKGDILLVGFQVHPDVRRGLEVSADYPGVVCSTLDNALPGTHTIYFNGTAGDLNHVDVNCPEWDANAGQEQIDHMGRTIAGRVLELYTKARPVASGAVKTAQTLVELPEKAYDPEKLPLALNYVRWHEAGEKEKIPYTGMEYITAVIEARQIIWRSQGGCHDPAPVSVTTMGDVAVVTVPGEGFCEVGRQLRSHSPKKATFTLGLANAYEGYFPTKDAFGVGGYEARTSHYLAGVAETITDTGISLLKNM